MKEQSQICYDLGRTMLGDSTSQPPETLVLGLRNGWPRISGYDLHHSRKSSYAVRNPGNTSDKGSQSKTSFAKTIWQSILKVNIYTSSDAAIPGYYLTEMLTSVYHKTCTRKFIIALFKIALNWELPTRPWTWINDIGEHSHNRML